MIRLTLRPTTCSWPKPTTTITTTTITIITIITIITVLSFTNSQKEPATPPSSGGFHFFSLSNGSSTSDSVVNYKNYDGPHHGHEHAVDVDAVNALSTEH